ncbi:hypothetical protein SAMN05216286_3680 [Kosakonia oryzae]|uniref:Uncharacterized protein n=1 Tax=Kosakonia oryzae TaxID=497725 RepID=A0AA94H5X4_9ENTR|nr:hypothetical protein SAMN05216286_3680 [Kosakonia oryzae]
MAIIYDLNTSAWFNYYEFKYFLSDLTHAQ